MKTLYLTTMSVCDTESFHDKANIIEAYAKRIAADALAKACEGQPIEVQQKIMSVKIETP